MRTMIFVFGIGALLWIALGRGEAPEPTGLQHSSAVAVQVGAGPERVGTARGRQLSAAVRPE